MAGTKTVGNGVNDVSPQAAKSAGLGLYAAGQIILDETHPFFTKYVLPLATEAELKHARSTVGKSGGGALGGDLTVTVSGGH